MSSDITHREFAEENEEFAIDISSGFEDKSNWIITIRFYSLIHYVEERLKSYGYDSRSHDGRKDNIRNCRYIDNKMRKLYRRLEDISRDARYECIRMDEEDVEKSRETLEEGKEILGLNEDDSDYKYNTS